MTLHNSCKQIFSPLKGLIVICLHGIGAFPTKSHCNVIQWEVARIPASLEEDPDLDDDKFADDALEEDNLDDEEDLPDEEGDSDPEDDEENLDEDDGPDGEFTYI